MAQLWRRAGREAVWELHWRGLGVLCDLWCSSRQWPPCPAPGAAQQRFGRCVRCPLLTAGDGGAGDGGAGNGGAGRCGDPAAAQLQSALCVATAAVPAPQGARGWIRLWGLRWGWVVRFDGDRGGAASFVVSAALRGGTRVRVRTAPSPRCVSGAVRRASSGQAWQPGLGTNAERGSRKVTAGNSRPPAMPNSPEPKRTKQTKS